jgi:carbamate kinase
MLETELAAASSRQIACLITHVHVDPDDPAFASPSKPIGPFYSAEEAPQLGSVRGWELVEDAGRGFRRVVPSPEPLEIVELAAIRALLASGAVAIACGGGGIPVVSRDGRLKGVDAVIDKDRASALLATRLGAERLVILTEVPAVYRRFRKSNQEEIRELSVEEAEALLPELAEGSMRPKLEAAVDFARSGGETLITSFEALAEALEGRAGTRIKP